MTLVDVFFANAVWYTDHEGVERRLTDAEMKIFRDAYEKDYDHALDIYEDKILTDEDKARIDAWLYPAKEEAIKQLGFKPYYFEEEE